MDPNRVTTPLAIALGAFLLTQEFAMAETINFDQEKTGALPAGWKSGVTGHGSPKWSVEKDETAPTGPNVLKQSASGMFPWCVKTDTSIENGSVEVKFKPISGGEDAAGGIVWRWKDGDNYYVARANALEDNVSLYHTTNGRRNTIKYVDAPVAKNQWHTLKVDFAGESIRVSLDGKLYISQETTTSRARGLSVYGRRRIASRRLTTSPIRQPPLVNPHTIGRRGATCFQSQEFR